ncbi:uncharacterized protein LOC121050663 [Rosa chinensis]|uniref:uncharacterized protein LOC121050663 n=1 Tax=Rosa chinensis TaxID=74649 RepID=UPI001AD8E1A8|nr:uncharacterized protein LOC121050663 [Rosa chinensis]
MEKRLFSSPRAVDLEPFSSSSRPRTQLTNRSERTQIRAKPQIVNRSERSSIRGDQQIRAISDLRRPIDSEGENRREQQNPDERVAELIHQQLQDRLILVLLQFVPSVHRPTLLDFLLRQPRVAADLELVLAFLMKLNFVIGSEGWGGDP